MSAHHKLVPPIASTAESTSSNSAVFGLINVRSLANKSFLCQDFILKNSIDFLFITESWLSPGYSVPLTEAYSPNYSCFNQPRLSGHGGGVAIIFNSNYKCSPVSLKSSSSFESLCFLLNGQYPILFV